VRERIRSGKQVLHRTQPRLFRTPVLSVEGALGADANGSRDGPPRCDLWANAVDSSIRRQMDGLEIPRKSVVMPTVGVVARRVHVGS